MEISGNRDEDTGDPVISLLLSVETRWNLMLQMISMDDLPCSLKKVCAKLFIICVYCCYVYTNGFLYRFLL